MSEQPKEGNHAYMRPPPARAAGGESAGPGVARSAGVRAEELSCAHQASRDRGDFVCVCLNLRINPFVVRREAKAVKEV